jgi:hypothetical protein
MSKPGKQFSLVGGVQSGAGALANGVGSYADQTGNLLNMMNTAVHTPVVEVGHSHTNFKGKKVRFGVVSAQGGHAFDYPELAIKSTDGNGQAYKASKSGYLPGNNGGGNAGYGCHRDVDLSTMVSADLTDAYAMAHRQADITGDMVAPEHTRTVNRADETLREHFEEQAKEHEKQKISHLMSMGFSEEEIARKAAKDREGAIESAAKMGRLQSTNLADAMIKKRGDVEMFWNNSVPAGNMANRINASSYERAVGGGTLTTRGKAAQAMRTKERMALKVDAETPTIKVPMKHAAIVQMMMGVAAKADHQRIEDSMVQEKKVIDHQKMRDDALMARHFAMEKALAKK